jgi:hypothetical protein
MKYPRCALAWLLMVPVFFLLLPLALAVNLIEVVIDWLGEKLTGAVDRLDPTMQPRIRHWLHG